MNSQCKEKLRDKRLKEQQAEEERREAIEANNLKFLIKSLVGRLQKKNLSISEYCQESNEIEREKEILEKRKIALIQTKNSLNEKYKQLTSKHIENKDYIKTVNSVISNDRKDRNIEVRELYSCIKEKTKALEDEYIQQLALLQNIKQDYEQKINQKNMILTCIDSEK